MSQTSNRNSVELKVNWVLRGLELTLLSTSQ
jgi:hypothetical protein